MEEGSRAAPVLMRRVRVEDFRQELRLHATRQQPIAAAGFGIDLGDVREGKDIHRIEETREWSGGPAGQRKSIVEASAAAAGNVREHAVEDLPVGFVFIEAVVHKRPKEAPALRNPKRDRTLHRTLRNGKLGGGSILQFRNRSEERRVGKE